MEFLKKLFNPREQRVLESQAAQMEQQRADIDYIAMMTDVELDNEESNE